MILRFQSVGSKPEFLAFNTALQTYTTDGECVRQGEVMMIPSECLHQIRREIDFNGWDYAENLHMPVVIEDQPF